MLRQLPRHFIRSKTFSASSFLRQKMSCCSCSSVSAEAGPSSVPSSSSTFLEPSHPGERAAQQTLELCGHKLVGISVAGQETCIMFPSLSIAFDIGRCPPKSVHMSKVFLSHAHMDHIGGLPFHAATRSLLGLTPPTYYVPMESLKATEAMIEAHRQLDGSDIPCTIVGVKVGDEIPLKANYIVRVIPTYHRIVSCGYVVVSKRTKLRADLRGKSREEIEAVKRNGESVTDFTEVPEIAFLGDTTAEALFEHELVRKARLLIAECTFIGESNNKSDSCESDAKAKAAESKDTIENARSKGHVHLDEIGAQGETCFSENEAVLLMHFSARYSAKVIQKRLEEVLHPLALAKVTPLLNAHK